jgi:hypothetical protein
MTTTVTQHAYELEFGVVNYPSGQAAVDAKGNLALGGSSTATASDTFTGVENRYWKDQVRNSRNATTSASGTTRTFKGRGPCGGVFALVVGQGYPDSARYNVQCFPNTLSWGLATADSNDTSNQNIARTMFAKEVEKRYTLFQGGTFLGELRQTLHMIRHPLSGLRKLTWGYLNVLERRAGRMRQLKRNVRERVLQDIWLEHSFGWLPLLGDLDDARKYLDRRSDALYREVLPVKVEQTKQWGLGDVQSNFISGVNRLLYRNRTRRVAICVLSGGVSSTASSKKLIDASAMGLAPRSFLPTLWEVFPWSFAVDYFSNVGEVIAAWSNQTLLLAWGRETLIRKRIFDCYDQRCVPASPPYQTSTVYFIPGDYYTEVKEFTRVAISSPPVPSLAFEMPGFGLKWLNLAALVRKRREIRLF